MSQLPARRRYAVMRHGLSALAAICLFGCSKAKTVEWEEEVELRRGESLWVKRTDQYEQRSEPGNPFKSAWWLTSRSIAFTWAGQSYQFSTETTSILMLRPSKEGGIAVVAWARQCKKPGYAEYRRSGTAWQIQPGVSPEFVGQPRNLTGFFSAVPGDMPARVSLEFKRTAGYELPQRGGQDAVLDLSRIANDCQGGN